MATIGRVLLIPKGDYNGTTVYNMLDWVRHDGRAWVCKVNGTSGVVPSSSTPEWQLLAQDGSVTGSVAWAAVTGKPFSGIGNGLNVDGSNNIELDISLLTGSNISYNHSSSGLSANDVQSAIDEIAQGGGGGGMLPYLYIDSEAGATVTVNQPDGTVITPTAAGSGHWECELTGGYGTYVIHSVLSGQGDATQSLAVDTVKEYHVTDTHYDHTISFVAPSGSTVRIVGGTETYTLTGTGSTQTQAVHSASTSFTVTATMDGNGKPYTFTTPSTTGQTTTIPSGTFDFGTINVSVAADFVTAGSTITCVKTGVNTISKTAASTLTFRVPETGEYTISGTVSGTPYSTTVTVTDLNTPESASLATMLTLTVDLYSAAVDTVSFTDDEGVKTVITDTDGHATATIKILPTGKTITFTSSVALDPDNLDGSHYYSKAVSITSATTSVYVMPDNALYWWGYNPDMMEQGSTANGWNSSYDGTNPPTFNTNDYVVGSSSCAYGTKNPITGTVYALIQGTAWSSSSIPDAGYASVVASKSTYEVDVEIRKATYESLTKCTVGTITNGYFVSWASGRAHKVNAVWYE